MIYLATLRHIPFELYKCLPSMDELDKLQDRCDGENTCKVLEGKLLTN